MSFNIVNPDGSVSQVAGNGKAEYGASTVRRGTVTVTLWSNEKVIASFPNLTGRTQFMFTLVGVVSAGETLTIRTDCPTSDNALIYFCYAQPL